MPRDARDPAPDRLTVPGVPASIAGVRRFAVAACCEQGLASSVCDSVALLVSEVATNAVVHGSGQVQVRVSTRDGVLRVEVADDSPTMPVSRTPASRDEGGRGLALVELLSRGWGAYREGDGKVVWFELS